MKKFLYFIIPFLFINLCSAWIEGGNLTIQGKGFGICFGIFFGLWGIFMFETEEK